MNRRLWLFAAITCVLSCGVAAQEPPKPEPPNAVAPDASTPAEPTSPGPPPAAAAKAKPPSTEAVVLDAASLQAISGRSVKSPTGEDMGRIVDMLVLPSGEVRAAVIDFGGFLGVGSRKIAVDWKALNFNDVAKTGNVIVALTRNQVRMAPEYKQGDPIVILEATSAAEDKAPAPPVKPAEAPAPAADPDKK